MAQMEKTGVAIVGMGTVGAGVARLLLDHGDRTARHAGRTLWLTHAVVRDTSKPRDVDLPDGILTDDLQRVIDDKSVSVVAQLIGGIEPARSVMLQLLESGKDVVMPNVYHLETLHNDLTLRQFEAFLQRFCIEH